MKVRVDVGVREFEIREGVEIDQFAKLNSNLMNKMWGTLVSAHSHVVYALMALDKDFDKDRAIKELTDLGREAIDALNAYDEVEVDVRTVYEETKEKCHADRDGDCEWEHCPQNRDGEPAKSGRRCPLEWHNPRESED